jgi:ABC-type transport system involved in cytochrome c biogenesis permease component
MSNNDIWGFANKVSAKYMIIASLVTIIFQLLGIILNYTSEYFNLVSYSFLIISLGLSIWKTEIEINKFFDNEGNRLKS